MKLLRLALVQALVAYKFRERKFRHPFPCVLEQFTFSFSLLPLSFGLFLLQQLQLMRCSPLRFDSLRLLVAGAFRFRISRVQRSAPMPACSDTWSEIPRRLTLSRSLSIARQCASPLVFSPRTTSLSLALFFFFISDMSQPSSSFQDLFNAALQEYENQTGCKLVEHPLAKQLESCDSVQSITAILQQQAQIFRNFRGDDGKLMKLLKSSVDVLYTLSISTVLGEGIGLVHPTSFLGVPCP